LRSVSCGKDSISTFTPLRISTGGKYAKTVKEIKDINIDTMSFI
jgi:hypothetical protein